MWFRLPDRSPSLRKARTGTKTETVGKGCLLTCPPALSQAFLPLFSQGHLTRYGATQTQASVKTPSQI